MPSERTLVAGAAVVLLVAAASAAALPGVLAEPGPEGPLRPGPVEVAEAPIAVGQVSGQTAELTIHAHLAHRGNPTENISVEFRAIDADSGLLAVERTVDVGTLRGDGVTRVTGTLPVEREGGYRLVATVYRNDTRVDRFVTEVHGLQALTPAYARSNVSFTDDPVLPPVSVSVADVQDGRVTLGLDAWLTAAGPTDGDDLSVRLIVRQADSNVVADRATVAAGDLRPGRTTVAEAEVTVPADYNYYVDAVLLQDGVVVDTARVVANLDPEETIRANETEKDVEFRVGDFEERGTETPMPAATEPAAAREGTVQTQTPGFGAAVAALALALVALFARRTRQ